MQARNSPHVGGAIDPAVKQEDETNGSARTLAYAL